MSLDWNLKGIKNADAVCWGEPATANDPMRGIEKGKQYMKPLTDALIWLTMAVDIGHITEKNADEFYRRVAMIETLNGASLSKWNAETEKHEARPITLDDVKAHIGLSTNVSTKTAKQFDAKYTKMVRESVERARRRAEHDAAGAQ
jgi:hypothetical protein